MRAGAQIGVNVTILPYVTIGVGAIIGAGSVVTRDVPPGVVAYGNPAVPAVASRSSKASRRACVRHTRPAWRRRRRRLHGRPPVAKEEFHGATTALSR